MADHTTTNGVATETVNGVPVSACAGLILAVQQDPANGQTKWSAVTTWKGGFQCENRIRDHVVELNEPEALGGTDTAPNMVEAVLAAYGSCLTVGYTLNAALRGITIRDLKVEVEGALDLAGFFGLSREVSPGFSNVKTHVYLDAEAAPEELEALHRYVLRTSPVGSILTQPLPVTTELHLAHAGAEA